MKARSKWVIGMILWGMAGACGVREQQQQATENIDGLYTALAAEDIATALDYFSTAVYDSAALAGWRATFNNNRALLGALESFQSTGNRQVQAGEAMRFTMVYDVTYTNGHAIDSITMQEENDTLKIVAYSFAHTDAEYLRQIGLAEEQARAYLRMVANGKFGEAYTMVGYHGREAASDQEWAMMLFDTSVAAGPVTSFKVQTDRSTLEVYDTAAAQPGYYYTIIAITTCANAVVQENLLFYQPDYGSPVMLINHGRRVVQ